MNVKRLTVKKIEELLPHYGMNDELLHEMPTELNEYYGKGIKFWQYPNQFAPYIKQLSKFEINSYLEIGCRWGGTFILTTTLLDIKDSMACDIIEESQMLRDYHAERSFVYFQNDSKQLCEINRNFDLILIDGDHSYEAVKQDFEICKRFNPKYIVFHDIVSDVCPGVCQLWSEIKDQYKHYEYIDQYESVNGTYLGIGLLVL